eukprot:scaffold131231_cov35-Prasinocladus_malaysianus.AAC.1
MNINEDDFDSPLHIGVQSNVGPSLHKLRTSTVLFLATCYARTYHDYGNNRSSKSEANGLTLLTKGIGWTGR